jgi:hypothetical protein
MAPSLYGRRGTVKIRLVGCNLRVCLEEVCCWNPCQTCSGLA